MNTDNCTICDAELRPDNRTGVCAECRLVARNRRLAAVEAERQRRQRRKRIVAQRLAELDGSRLGAPNSAPSATDSAERA
jgi:hypothetical protein